MRKLIMGWLDQFIRGRICESCNKGRLKFDRFEMNIDHWDQDSIYKCNHCGNDFK